MQKRINYIDIARGFAIIFIVLGHACSYSEHIDSIHKLVNSFHVALFFILSGYIFKIKENQNFIQFFKNKFFRIMVPYFIWSFLFLIPYMLLEGNVASNLDKSTAFDIKKSIIGIFYGIGKDNLLKQNSPLWFLPALFSMNIIYYFIIKLQIKNKLLMLIPLTIIAYISVYYLKINLPLGLNTVLNLGLFFYIGFLLKEYNVLNKDNILFKWYTIIFLIIIGLISCFLNKETVSHMHYKYGYFTLTILSTLTFSFITIYISMLINKNKVLEYIGKNTLGILIFHKLIILIFQTKLGIITELLKNSNTVIELLISLFIVLVSIVFSLVITEILRKIAPYTIGESKNKRIQVVM